MKVRVLQTPKSKPQSINPFSNPYEENETPHMAYGGNFAPANWSNNAASNRTIDTKWDWMRKDGKDFAPQSPYAKIGHQLPEVPEEIANVNAEKQEQVMGDFTGDGMPTLMNVGGKPHSEGGKNLLLPDNAFVFSDTPSLKIKDPEILAKFGGGTKPQTPAQLAKKYDLNKYKAKIDDKMGEEIDRNTNKLNYGGAVKKLNELAAIQESMKKAKGIPYSDLPDNTQVSKYGGWTIPRAQYGTKVNMTDPYTDNNPLTDEQIYNYTNDAVEHPIDYARDYNAGRSGASLNGSGRMDLMGAGYRNIQDRIASTPPAKDQPWNVGTGQTPISRVDPYTGGASEQGTMSPQTDMPQMPQFNSNEEDGSNGGGNKSRFFNRLARRLNPMQDPNFMGKLSNDLNQLSYPHTFNKREVAIPFYQQFVGVDNRADQQGLQGLAAALGQNQGNGPIGRANLLATQGNILNEFNKSNQDTYRTNVGEAARIGAANQSENARVQNLGIQGMKDYISDVNNSQKDYWAKTADYNKNATALYNADMIRKRNFQWMNMNNPYYHLNENNGFVDPQTKAQKAALEKMLNGESGYSSDDLGGKNSYIEGMLAAGLIDKAGAMELYKDEAKYRLHPTREKISYKNGMPQYSVSGTEEELGNPYHSKFGGKKSLKSTKKGKVKMRVIGVPQ